MQKEIKLWIGGRRWGTPSTSSPFRTTGGIYLTTEHKNALKSKNGTARLVRIPACSEIRWLELSQIPKNDLLDFITRSIRIKTRHRIIDYIAKNYKNTEYINASVVLNLCLAYDALTDTEGLFLSEWLVSRGIDASLYEISSGEQWVILFNPKLIAEYSVIPSGSITNDLKSISKIC